MANCDNFRLAGELLCQLLDITDVMILVRGAADEDEELTMTVTRRNGRRLHALAGDVIGLLQDALRDQRRKHCSRCRKVRGEGDFSGGDRWCLVCRRELAGVRRQRKKRATKKLAAAEGTAPAEPPPGTLPPEPIVLPGVTATATDQQPGETALPAAPGAAAPVPIVADQPPYASPS
jgi:hypothetical protein